MTTAQLKELWNKGSKVTKLSEIDPSFPDTTLKLFGPGTDSGTFDFFTEQINGEEGVSRTDYQPSEDDNVLVQGVEGEAGGLGYFGFSYYEQNQDKLNLVGVGESAGNCLKPDADNIQSGEYKPLSRPLLMYPSAKAIKQPEVKAFMDYVVQNYQSIAEASADRADEPGPGLRGADRARRRGARWQHAATAVAKGSAEAPVLRAARRRWGEDLIKGFLMLAALISVLTTTGIVLSLLTETVRFFEEVPVGDYLFGTDWAPLFNPASFGVLPLVLGTMVISLIGDARGGPAGARGRHLPGRVRPPGRAQDDQADPRAAGRRARRSSSATSR